MDNTNEMFSLFSEEELQEIEVKPEKKENQKTSKPAQSKSAVAKFVEPDEYDIDRVVYYAGHRFPVESHFLKLEEVREQLEEQFPELTKENTDMVYDEKTGHIVPVLKGHRKGADRIVVNLLPPKLKTPVFHVLGKDGLYEVRETQVGMFAARVEPKMAIKPFTLKVPKIPVRVLAKVVRMFCETPDIERSANIVWDANDGYSVVFPEQTGTSVTVCFEGYIESESNFIVLQLHSHGRLPAFFSSTDDADEIRTGFYSVIGKCNVFPQATFRFSCGGKFVKINAIELFDGNLEGLVRLV